MKIIVMGTGAFAVPTIQWLCESRHEIGLVVTRPIGDPGRRRKTIANPVLEFTTGQGNLEIVAPMDVNETGFVKQLERIRADLLFVCDFGQILKRRVLECTSLGGINLHGSLLPRFRGAAPVNWAILCGETETGVTVIHMTPGLDAGPCLSTRTLPIGEMETAEELEPRLAQAGVPAVEEAIELLESWDGKSPVGEIQDARLVTRAPRLKKQQGNIDWHQTACQIVNQIRAFQPWPGSFTHWLPKTGKPCRLIVHRASFSDSVGDVSVGGVADVSDEGVSIVTSTGVVTLQEVQPAGKKRMGIIEFLRGRPVRPDDVFGDP